MNVEQKNIWKIWALVAILSFGCLLRFWHLGNQSLWIDEGFSINAAMAIEDRGVPVLDSGAFYRNGILSSYLIAGSRSLFGYDPMSPIAERLPAAFFGTALIALVYFSYRRFFDDDAGALVASGLVALLNWEIAWSRQARGYAACSFFVLLAVTLMWTAVQHRQKSFATFAFCSLVLAWISQESALAFLLPFAATSVAIFAFPERFSNKWKLSVWIYGTTVVAILPSFFDWTSRHKILLSFMSGSPIELRLCVLGLLLSISAIVLGLAKDASLRFIVAMSASAIILCSFFSVAGQDRYFFCVIPLLLLAFVRTFWMLVHSCFPHKSKAVSGLVCAILLFIIFVPSLVLVPRSAYWLESGSPQPDFKNAYKAIQSSIKPNEVVISAFPQLHKIYLGQKGMWLKMDFNGPPGGSDKKVIDGRDFYVGAPILFDMDQLRSYIKQSHGYVVIDSMSSYKWLELFPYLENEPGVQRIFHSLSKKSSSDIYVFKF